jgi:hypothetical protein
MRLARRGDSSAACLVIIIIFFVIVIAIVIVTAIIIAVVHFIALVPAHRKRHAFGRLPSDNAPTARTASQQGDMSGWL